MVVVFRFHYRFLLICVLCVVVEREEKVCVVVQGPLEEKLLRKDLLCVLVPGLVEEEDMSQQLPRLYLCVVVEGGVEKKEGGVEKKEGGVEKKDASLERRLDPLPSATRPIHQTSSALLRATSAPDEHLFP